MKHLSLPLGRLLLIVSVALYAAALMSKAVGEWPGSAVLLYGWGEALLPDVDPAVRLAWFANPLLFFGWLLGGPRYQPIGRVCTLMSLTLTLNYFIFGKRIVRDEGGVTGLPIQFTLAYLFWVSSIAIAAVRSFVSSHAVNSS